MNRASTLLDLSRMTAKIAVLEGRPVPQITAAIRREAAAIRLVVPDVTVRAWAEAVHRGDEFRLH
ncbi:MULTISPECIES: hypothetical protein [Paenarthrobacter]|uniref:Uncharacterized protein n=1 Tax=Paenarthrobacter ureafaciens TaxID=37931 RepID=A0AAX3EQ23_PAEUR|nr:MULTISPECIES: hypothetical protein [Paenarthrobacter]MDO5867042.1 hypothetical protein [Paenarthrobacter sp. SD-2]MDO5878209.1 hypothetical protein [Paenarthrobacter sp. SD-1]UYV95467.1 hypothetical protein NL395_22930 [Paenarthrobacter ureafaciens]UYW00077.1 hypothetical protein NL394_23315 [Paenarthrobacter ureafaciens]WIV33568.1 hypothetical protein QN084_23695 [Paenarthrobacter sp. R1]